MPGRKSVGGVVRLLDGLGRRAEGQDRQHRSEDLVPRDAVTGLHVREDGRREPEPLVGDDAVRRPAVGALLVADPAELAHAVELLERVDRADVGVLVERVAEPQGREPRLEPLDDLVVDRLLHEQAAARAADLALIEEDARDDPVDRLLDGGVLEDDVRGLAAELERHLLVGARDCLRDLAADRGRPGEGDLVDTRMPHQRRSGGSGARHDVDNTRRQIGLLEDLGEQQRGERRGLGRFQHDGVARRRARGRSSTRASAAGSSTG